MTLSSAIDLTNLSGFAKTYFEILDRFRNVAIDNHTSSGNLSDVTAHIKGVTDPGDMVQAYDPPILWSVPSPLDPDFDTVAGDYGTVSFRIISWVWDKDEQYALEQSALTAAKTVNNVEADRSLTDGNPTTPVRDTTMSQFSPDFRVSGAEQPLYLKFTEVEYDVEYERTV
jgi:hypothetical protein